MITNFFNIHGDVEASQNPILGLNFLRSFQLLSWKFREISRMFINDTLSVHLSQILNSNNIVELQPYPAFSTDRTDPDPTFRESHITSMGRARKTFSPQEDEALVRLITANGTTNWGQIARCLDAGFTPRQCRERWKNYLDPRLAHTEWTEEEDRRLIAEYNQMGPRWIPLSRLFSGRSGNAVRNRVFVLLRKKAHEPKERVFPIPILNPPVGPDPEPADPASFHGVFSLCEASQFLDLQEELFRLFYSAD
jgi:hypothetical protein